MRRSTSYNGFKIVNEVRFKKEIQYGELFLQNPFLTSYNLDGKHNIIEIENKWLILTSIVLYFQSSKMNLVYLWVDQSIIKWGASSRWSLVMTHYIQITHGIRVAIN